MIWFTAASFLTKLCVKRLKCKAVRCFRAESKIHEEASRADYC